MRKIIGALAVWLALCGAALAQTCPSLPFTFTANTVIHSAQVNSNFTSLLNCQNTLLAPTASPVFTGTVTIPTLTLTNPLAVTGGGTGLGTLTANNLLVGNGTSGPTFIAPGSQGQALVSSGSVWQAGVPVLRSYLAGMGMSNDTTTPNAVLDIAVGQAADSTNVTMIALGQTFFKSTGGAWSAGAGTAGSPKTAMGTSLTIANSTWYAVCAIINAAAADVYFDTDVACSAHAPASTTAARRIGSFLTDGTAHILPFIQRDDYFYWKTPVQDQNATPLTAATPTSLTLASVPLGLQVRPLLNVEALEASGPTVRVRLYSPDLGDNNTNADMTLGFSASGTVPLVFAESSANYVNTSQQIRAVAPESGITITIFTTGWVDTRGRNL